LGVEARAGGLVVAVAVTGRTDALGGDPATRLGPA